MDTIITTLKVVVVTLNALSPLGLAAMLSFIIYQLVAKKGQIRTISENHLSGLPEMSDTLKRIEEGISDSNKLLVQLVADMGYLKGRINGRS